MQRVCNFNLLKSHEFFNQFDFEKLESFSIQAPYIPQNNLQIVFDNNIIKNCTIPITEYIDYNIKNEEIENDLTINEELQNNIYNFLKDF